MGISRVTKAVWFCSWLAAGLLVCALSAKGAEKETAVSQTMQQSGSTSKDESDTDCGRMYLWGREVHRETYNENARLARCASQRNEAGQVVSKKN